jgi:iron-sulfur cluster assembly accessory protein
MAILLTKKAEDKVKEILAEQPEPYAGLRIQVVGGGCSGFQYRMGFDKNYNDQNDQLFEFDGLKVFVDTLQVHAVAAVPLASKQSSISRGSIPLRGSAQGSTPRT